LADQAVNTDSLKLAGYLNVELMSKKKQPVRLSTKALMALKSSYSTEFKTRAIELERINEYSFAIILYWNRLEAILKVLYYRKHIDKEYPDKLNFINKNWSVLKNAYNNNQNSYKIVLGDGGKSSGSLWHTRDRISHANHAISYGEYNNYKEAVTWLIDQLLTNLPLSYDIAHKDFLKNKKKIVGNIEK